MNEKLMSYEIFKKEKHKFFEKHLESCDTDWYFDISFYKRCKIMVHIDRFINPLFCVIHIVLLFDVAYNEELYKENIKNDFMGGKEKDKKYVFNRLKNRENTILLKSIFLINLLFLNNFMELYFIVSKWEVR